MVVLPKNNGADANGEAPGVRARAGATAELDTAEKVRKHWLKLWAFGTSPYGLGLEPNVFWALDKEEHKALIMVWAAKEATFHNAHFSQEGVPWIPEDFMGLGSREQRKQKVVIDGAKKNLLDSKLQRMKKGVAYDNIPDWAFGRKGRPVDGGQCNRTA